MRKLLLFMILAGYQTATGAFSPSCARAADRAPVSVSKAQKALETASADEKFTYVLFWRENNAATKSMAQTLKSSLAERDAQAVWTTVNITDSAEKAVVDRFAVSRTPMPTVISVAPNGAITGVFSEKLSATNIDEALVTPTMTKCMKAMQEGKLVLLCVQPQADAPAPRGVRDFQADPQFKQRTAVVSMVSNDPAEKRFLAEMQISGERMNGPVTVFMAPPGVMVGKFAPNVTKEILAQKLHAAGKCCDDANCKHNHQGK